MSSKPWTGQERWHRADWGPLGWAETAIKLIGIAVAVVAAARGGAWAVAADHPLAHWLLMVTAVGYVVAIFDRVQDREVTAMGFWALMVTGHGAMVWAAGGDTWPEGSVVLFALLMALGDAVKIVFFVTTRAQVRDLPRRLPIVMTATLLVLYLLIAALAVA